MESARKKSSGLKGGCSGHSLTNLTGWTGKEYGVESPVKRRTKTPLVRGLPSDIISQDGLGIDQKIDCRVARVRGKGLGEGASAKLLEYPGKSVHLKFTNISYALESSPYFICNSPSMYRGLSAPAILDLAAQDSGSPDSTLVEIRKVAAVEERNLDRDSG